MKCLLLGLAASLVSLCDAAPRSWTFGDGTALSLEVPEGVVCEQVSPPSDTANQAFTLRYPDIEGVSTITLQFMVTKVDTATDWTTAAKVDEFLLRAGKRGLQGSVEKALKPVHLKMKQGVGGYLIFTDAELAQKAITKPGVFRQMLMIACGMGRYKIFVRGYTNSTTEPYFTRMMEMIERAAVTAK